MDLSSHMNAYHVIQVSHIITLVEQPEDIGWVLNERLALVASIERKENVFDKFL